MNFDSQDPDNGDDDRKRDSSRKRDGKRDKKEKGYQMFEEEDSEEEQLMLAEDMKSPSKQKKERAKPSFKFPVRKEKTKDKEDKKEKEAKKEEKEKKREEKVGKKLKKDKKKSKHAAAPVIAAPSNYENPIFGVPLAIAVERNKSHDGIELPAIVRECIDYIEECGLACEGIYRISGVKSKVQHLKDCYNRHEPVYLFEHEPNVVASLLKQFLRDLPEPVLTTAHMPAFEEASVIKSSKKKTEAFTRLIAGLPACNRLLLSWMIVHMTHVIELAKENKMTLQNVSIVLSPTMQISHRVLNILFSNADVLFAGVTLRKYVPPLKPAHSKWSLELPDNPIALEEELAKQESLLNQLHADLNSGLTDPEIEEQLWEVQRVVTQLKRKIKMAKKNTGLGERRKTTVAPEPKKSSPSSSSLPSLSAPEELQLQLRAAPDQSPGPNVSTVTAVVEATPQDAQHRSSPPGERKGVRFAQEEEEEDESNKPSAESEVSKEKDEGTKDTPAPSDKEPTPSQDKEKETSDNQTETKQVADNETTPDSSETKDDKEKTEADSSAPTPQQTEETEVQKESAEEDKEVAASESAAGDEGEPVEKATLSPPSQSATEGTDEDQATPRASPKHTEAVRTPVTKRSSRTSTSSNRSLSASEEKVQLEHSPVVMRPPDPPRLPPYMSTAVLQPMKADPPRAILPSQDQEETEKQRKRSEKLRELEEELLWGKKKKVSLPEDDEEAENIDDLDLDQLLEDEYAAGLEEEELLAIADELRQKISTERSEMERLSQEIQELQYLRQDSDLEDLSSSSSSSEDSEEEEDMQGYLAQLLQDNQELEVQNADLCQKIHEERMICLSVKLQIRLLQQKQLEASYG